MTQTILIDAARYPTARALHLALKMMLDLPEHYGCNADALHDCLSSRWAKVNALILTTGEGETAQALRKVAHVLEDLGGEVTYI